MSANAMYGRPARSAAPGSTVTSSSAAAQHLADLRRLRRVRDRIDREYAQPLDVEALARDAHMSAGHFSREFKRAYGESPYSYLMTRRIERAMALLRRGDLNVTEVCFEVGCSSLGTFSTRFAELVGMPPSTYRRRAAEEGIANVSFVRADVQIADLGEARYDRNISRNGVMFFADPVAAFANLARAVTPDGRLVLQVWQPMSENPWFTDFRRAVPSPVPPPDGPGPFALGDPDRVRSVLTAAGFAEPELRGVREPRRRLGPSRAPVPALDRLVPSGTRRD